MYGCNVLVFDGILLDVPVEFADLFPTNYTYETFPTNYCGAGNGIGEKIVPDYIFGWTRCIKFLGLSFDIKISPACWVHDEDWWFAEPTWEAFKETNSRFKRNITNIIHTKGRNDWIKAKALYRAVTYRNAVTLHGARFFWTTKFAQGLVIPHTCLKYVSFRGADRIKKAMGNDSIESLSSELIKERSVR